MNRGVELNGGAHYKSLQRAQGTSYAWSKESQLLCERGDAGYKGRASQHYLGAFGVGIENWRLLGSAGDQALDLGAAHGIASVPVSRRATGSLRPWVPPMPLQWGRSESDFFTDRRQGSSFCRDKFSRQLGGNNEASTAGAIGV